MDPVAYAQEYLKQRPDDARTWAALGSAYVERARRSGDSGFYAKAQGALERSLSLQPDANADALIAMAALANGRHEFAAGHLWANRALSADPSRSAAYGAATDALVELGRYDEAERVLARMLALRPDVASFTRAAHLAELRGQDDRAALALDRALGAAADPADIAFVRFRLGELRFNQGDPAEALEHYQLALHEDSGYALALAGTARAQAALGRTGEAVAMYEAAIARLPLPQFSRELGELLQSLGRADEAARYYATVQGDVLTEADHGDPAEAVRLASREWRRRQSVDVADAMSWALLRAGRPEAALPYAKKTFGRNALFDYHRGQIERALGHQRAARTFLSRSLATNPHFSPLWAARAGAVLVGMAKGKHEKS